MICIVVSLQCAIVHTNPYYSTHPIYCNHVTELVALDLLYGGVKLSMTALSLIVDFCKDLSM